MANNKGIQFKPYDALKGYSEEILKQEKQVIIKPVLEVDKLEELQNAMQSLTIGTEVVITYYRNQSILKIVGKIKKIDVVYKKITVNETVILINDILDIKA